jgi:hypothetical protein
VILNTSPEKKIDMDYIKYNEVPSAVLTLHLQKYAVGGHCVSLPGFTSWAGHFKVLYRRYADRKSTKISL